MSQPPIADYALIGDCHSAALVSRQGSVDWCCFHRFDARPVFARLLDWDRGGYCAVVPASPAPSTTTRRYVPDTNVLETRFQTDDGVLVLTDCLAARDASDALHPHHQLLRLARCDAGDVELTIDLRPRFDFGLTVPRLELRDRHVGVVYGGADALVVHSSVPLEQIERCGCSGSTTLRSGDEAYLAITYALPHELDVGAFDLDEAKRRVARTVDMWSAWASRCEYSGPWEAEVKRSALVLKALTNLPTGAIVAAPTTSLPEELGGVRNWDYRYAWLRDAALDLYALFRLGYTDEAHGFMTWLRRTTAGRAEDLQPLYGVGGERVLPEVELGGVRGYRDSRPVRIGNAATGQVQLDVYGELVDTAWLYHRHGGEIDEVFWEFVREIVDVVADRWAQPDEGIWEVRDGPRHFVSSKVMAWVAVDRAIRLATARGLPGDLRRWRDLRAAIRSRVEAEGVDPATGAFVRAFGSTEVDASNLLIPLVRFLRADDPRVAATVRRIERELTVDGMVHRYAVPDGLPGKEGAFVICTFWLVDNLALIGEVERATELFETVLGRANDVGLLAEQIDARTGDALGNFPQAFSHVGLIGAALNLVAAGR